MYIYIRKLRVIFEQFLIHFGTIVIEYIHIPQLSCEYIVGSIKYSKVIMPPINYTYMNLLKLISIILICIIVLPNYQLVHSRKKKQ